MAGTDERDPCDDFEHLQKELADYDERLVDKPYVVVGNKKDEETAEANMDRFRKKVFQDRTLFHIRGSRGRPQPSSPKPFGAFEIKPVPSKRFFFKLDLHKRLCK